MLSGHSEFFLSQPAIYFGVPEFSESEEDLFQEVESHTEFQLNLSCPSFPLSSQPKTGMYIKWYDLPQ